MSKIEARLKSLGLDIPVPAKPVANYVGWVKSGSLIFTAGQLAMVNGAVQFPGLVGATIDMETAKKAARICAINVVAQLKAACDGDLERISRIVKITCFVASPPDFLDHPKVANGASDLFVDVFGEIGIHARSAVGVACLPFNACVEVEALAEFH